MCVNLSSQNTHTAAWNGWLWCITTPKRSVTWQFMNSYIDRLWLAIPNSAAACAGRVEMEVRRRHWVCKCVEHARRYQVPKCIFRWSNSRPPLVPIRFIIASLTSTTPRNYDSESYINAISDDRRHCAVAWYSTHVTSPEPKIAQNGSSLMWLYNNLSNLL